MIFVDDSSSGLPRLPHDPQGDGDPLFATDWRVFAFWRTVFAQQEVEKLARTAIDFPSMRRSASFNLDSVKAQIEAASKNRTGN